MRAQALKAKSTNPVLINSCEFDDYFPLEKQKEADVLLGEGRYTPGYERTYWEGCTHGFATRGDVVREYRRRGLGLALMLLIGL